MKAVVLAGGQGTRLKGIIKDIPKPMAPIGNKPFLEYIIRQLRKAAISEIVISTGYRADVIKSYFGNGEKLNVLISYSEEIEPLGTGGAIKKALKTIDDENVIVMNGDSFLEINFHKLMAFHNDHNASVTIGLMFMEDTGRYGAAQVNDKGEIISFTEKGTRRKGFINGGIYVTNRKIVDCIPDGPVSLEKDIFPLLLKRGLYGISVSGLFIDIGVPEDYLRLRDNPGNLNLILERNGSKNES
jgi:NDP-sugar pyrophosphorylase family protein